MSWCSDEKETDDQGRPLAAMIAYYIVGALLAFGFFFHMNEKRSKMVERFKLAPFTNLQLCLMAIFWPATLLFWFISSWVSRDWRWFD
jgi:hypothetical protein